jgi:hypothetical protein
VTASPPPARPPESGIRGIRSWYVVRLLGNAWANTFSWATLRTVAGGLVVLAGIVVLRTLTSAQQDKVAEASQNVIETIIVTFAIGAVFFVLNLVLAPWRLDQALRRTLHTERRSSTASLRAVEADRDRANEALRRHLAATEVTIDVDVVAVGPLVPVDDGDEAIEDYITELRRELGGPEPPRPGRTPQQIIEEARLMGSAFAAIAGESRSLKTFLEQVDAWVAKASNNGREESYRLAMAAQIAQIRVLATNTGPRQLSDVRAHLFVDRGVFAWWPDDPLPKSMFPKPPRAWAATPFGGLVPAVDLSTIHAYPKVDRDMSTQNDELKVDFEPLTLPPGDTERVGSIVLAIPAAMAGRTLVARWRVTAKEAENDKTGSIELPIAPDLIKPLQLNKQIEARKSKP